MSTHSMHTYNVIFKRSHCIADVSFFEYISNALSSAEEIALTRTNISLLLQLTVASFEFFPGLQQVDLRKTNLTDCLGRVLDSK